MAATVAETVAGAGVEVAGTKGTSITESLTINELLSSAEGNRGVGNERGKGRGSILYVCSAHRFCASRFKCHLLSGGRKKKGVAGKNYKHQSSQVSKANFPEDETRRSRSWSRSWMELKLAADADYKRHRNSPKPLSENVCNTRPKKEPAK